MNRKISIVLAAVGLIGIQHAQAAPVLIGFESSEGYTAGQFLPSPWTYFGGNNSTTEQVRVSTAEVHSGTQSLAITPNFSDCAYYPIHVPPGESAHFSVWVRTSIYVGNGQLGGVGVVSYHSNNVWRTEEGVSFQYNYFSAVGLTKYNIAFVSDGATLNAVGDFNPSTWYKVDCQIAPTQYIYTVTIDSETSYSYALPRNASYTVKQIALNYAYQTVYYDDLIYTPPELPASLTIQSSLGTPVPAVGTHTYTVGNVVTCQVASVTQGLTNYSASGWTATGHSPASGGGNQAILTLTADTVLTWNWQTNYWVDTSVVGQGSVSGGDAWHAAGTSPSLTASPEAGWLFMGWSGDLTSGYTQTSASLLINAPKSVTATFSDDADSDGLLNNEEVSLGTNPRSADSDGDGFDDRFETQVGLSPTNNNSNVRDYILARGDTFGLYPSNAVLDVAVNQMLIKTEAGQANLNLQLLTSDDLITWTNAGEAVEWSIPAASSEQYFRVRAHP